MARRKKRALIVVFIACAAICLLAGFFGKFQRGEKEIAIKPGKDYPAGTVAAYRQKDERWKDDRLGGSVYRMGGSGCLTSCIASALTTQYLASGCGRSLTAGELNQLFGEKDVYDGDGNIVWNQIVKALPEAEVLVASAVTEEEIESLLAQGHYPIVKVKVGGKGAPHWVLLAGSENGEYLCMDPLAEEGNLIPLSRHGGVVYRMRCVYWRE